MKKLLLLSAVVVVPLVYGIATSAIAVWSARHPGSTRDAPDELRSATQAFEKGKAECAALTASAGTFPQTVPLTQTTFIRHGKRDARDGDTLLAAQKAWLREFDRRAEAEQCAESFVRALRDIRRVQAIEAFSGDLANSKGFPDVEKSNLSRYLTARLVAEKNREEATRAFSTATNSSGFDECMKCCDKFRSEVYDYPFTTLRAEVEALKQKAKEEHAWHGFVESQEDDVAKLGRINDFITSYPMSSHVQGKSLGEAERYRRQLQANVDWNRADQEELEAKPKIFQLHRFVEDHPEDPRVRQAVGRASGLLEGLFRVKVLNEMELKPTIRLVSRRNLLVSVGTPMKQDAEKIVVELSDGKRSTFLRSSLAGEPEYTEDYKRRATFNAELAKTGHSLKNWDAALLDGFAQTCRTLQFEEQAVYVIGLAEMVRVCPKFQKLASGGSQTD